MPETTTQERPPPPPPEPTLRYQWKIPQLIPVDAQNAGERLEQLRRWTGGFLEPEQIVDDARPKGSVLHRAFEWDDRVAAEAFRVHQARHMLRSIVVVREVQNQHPVTVRAFVSVRPEPEKPLSYTAIGHAMSVAELRRQVLTRALNDLVDFRERYRGYKELAQIFEAIDAYRRQAREVGGEEDEDL